MTHDHIQKDLQLYKKTLFITAFSVLSLVGLLTVLAWALDFTWLIRPLLGLFAGAFLATINVAALGYAFHVIAIKKGSPKAVLWPLSSFLLMIAAIIMLLCLSHDYLLGFALGLTVPVVFGAAIAWLCAKTPCNHG